MIHFECDYTEGAHPAIMQRLCETNMEQTAGYGNDPYCEHAAELIRKLCNAPAAGVHFLVGGTQANKTVIAATLRPYQGVIAADSGHIAVHETGAIESTGHKVLTLPGTDGKSRQNRCVTFAAPMPLTQTRNTAYSREWSTYLFLRKWEHSIRKTSWKN